MTAAPEYVPGYHRETGLDLVDCPSCTGFYAARTKRIPKSLDDGARTFRDKLDPDIAWLRRKRACTVCGTEFLTAEISEALLQSLLLLREKEGRRRAAALRLDRARLRARYTWLNTTGDDVPQDLARQLVAESAWWLTHGSGRPVRAPRHGDRLQRLDCGWAVEFGANWFAAGSALARAREITKHVLDLADQGYAPSERRIRDELDRVPEACVLNSGLDFYPYYRRSDAGRLVFGAQAIDVNDCERVLLEVTGLQALLAVYAKAESEE